MPIVQISIVQGRSKEKREALLKKLTEVISEILEVRKDQVHIVIHEVPIENTTKARPPESLKI